MKVTGLTRTTLDYRRNRRGLLRDGFEEVSESGDPLWKFQRGGWHQRRITDVAIGPDGQTLFIKVST